MKKARSTRCGGRTVRYGAKGARVMPGTPKGDAYCARSLGQMRDYPAAAADPCSPLRLSRKRWACKGGKSMKSNPATDRRSANTQVANTVGTYAKVAEMFRDRLSKRSRVLDFGAGFGLGTVKLIAGLGGASVDSYEPFPENWQGGSSSPDFTDTAEIPIEAYDLVVCLNVLNVLRPGERLVTLTDIWNATRPGGCAVIMVRSKDDVEKASSKTPSEDGWMITNKGEINFQKGFTADEFMIWLQANLNVSVTRLKLSGIAYVMMKP